MDHAVNLSTEQVSLSESSIWHKLPVIGGIVGIVGLGAGFALGQGHKLELLYSYLFAYLYFLTIALGGLFFVILHHLCRAGWSVVVRRLAEHIAWTMPLFAVLFLPIAISYGDIFYWANAPADDAILAHKAAYFEPAFFFARAVFYLVTWILLARFYNRLSKAQDETGGIEATRKMQTWSAISMVLFGVTINFASFDWIMSLDPHWFSTIFGVYFFSGSFVAALATMILIVLQLQRSGQLQNVVTFEHFHDLGKLLFAFTVFWAYIGFSQFMLIWYGNLPEETAWFDHRWGPEGWQMVSIVLAAGHFALPFLFLLFSDHKRRRWSLTFASVWMLAFHAIDIYWLVMPNLALMDHDTFHDFHPSLINVACFLGVGGLFMAVLAWRMKEPAPLVPIKDPRLAESLAFENI